MRTGRLPRLIAVLALAGAFLVATAAPAWAHAVLETTSPVANAVLERAPAEIDLHFSEGVEISGGSVRLLTCAGQQISTSAPRHGDGASDVVVGGIPDDLAGGTYVVVWRVISADAHPVHGAFSFKIGSDATADIGSCAANTTPASSKTVGTLFAIMRFALFTGLALLIGGVVFWLTIAHGTSAAARARKVAWVGWLITFLATVGGLMLQGPYAAGTGVGDAFKWSVIDGILDTRYGSVAVQRLGLLVVAFFVLLALGRNDGRGRPATWLLVIAAGVGILLAATPGRAGHAGTGDWTWIAVPLDTVHVIAMSLWFGGIVALVATALGGGFSGGLRRALGSFSRIAFWCVIVLVVTGVFASWRQVGFHTQGFTDTSFGNLLVVKIALVAVLIALAAVSRKIVRERQSAPLDAPDSVVAAIDDRTVKGLRKSVAAEVLIGVAVLAVTAMLVQAQPARTAIAPGLYSTEIKAGTGDNAFLIDVTIDPAQSGLNAIHVYTLTPQGENLTILKITGSLSQGDSDIPAELNRGGPNHFTNENLVIPGGGEWLLTLHVFRAEIGDTAVTAKVPIR